MESADFQMAKFKAGAHFGSVTISGAASFGFATFSADANFASATFKRAVSFVETTFSAKATFNALDDSKQKTFLLSKWVNAKFLAGASFANRIFGDRGDFRGTLFVRAPRFHGCAFHEAMVFPDEGHFKDRSSRGAAQAYRTLRLAMEKMSARLEAGRFYALEHESRRNTPGEMKFTDRLLSWLYARLSDYGRDAVRPLLLMVAVALGSGLLYAWISGSPLSMKAPVDWSRIGNAMSFIFEQVVQPVGVWRDVKNVLFGDAGSIPLWLRWVCTFQSLVSLALMALSLLAVRWRFKRE
jgi:hypothetical protein